jgi:hypothetical protein
MLAVRHSELAKSGHRGHRVFEPETNYVHFRELGLISFIVHSVKVS